MPGLALVLIGMVILLVAPLQRVIVHHRRERPHVSAQLRQAYPPPPADGFGDDLLDRMR